LALRARELYYFVRIGNFATRPLRQLEADFRTMGASSEVATERLAALQAQSRKLLAAQQEAASRAMVPGIMPNVRLAAIREAQKHGEALAGVNSQITRQNELLAEQQVMARQAKLGAFTDAARGFQYASAGVVLGFGLMAHAAANFNTEVAAAATQVGTSFRGMQRATGAISQGILKQMQQFPASAKEMADAAYQIYSSVTLVGNQSQQTAQGLKVLRLANMAAVGGFTDLGTATQSVIRIYNIFAKRSSDSAKNLEQLKRLLDITASTVRFGAFNFKDFTAALANAAPAALSANQSLGQLGGAVAFLSRALGARSAAVSYARLLEFIQRGEEGFKKFGISIRDSTTHAMLPLSEIITEIIHKWPGLVTGQLTFIKWAKEITKGTGVGTMGTIQFRRALTLLIQHNQDYLKVLHDTINTHGQFAKSYEIMRKTAGIRWQVFLNQLHAISIELGATLIPFFEKFSRPIQEVVKWFNNLHTSTKNLIVTITAWVAGLTLVVSTIGVVLGSLARLKTSIMILRGTQVIGPAGITSLERANTRAGRLLGLLGRIASVGFITITITMLIVYELQAHKHGIENWLNNLATNVRQKVHNTFGAIGLGFLVPMHGGPAGTDLFPDEARRRAAQAFERAAPHDMPLGRLRGRDWGETVKTVAARTSNANTQQQRQNLSIQQYIKLLEQAQAAVKKDPSYANYLRLSQITDEISKKFKGPVADAINSVASANDKAAKRMVDNANTVNQSLDQMVQKYEELKQANETAFGDVTQQPLVQNMMQYGIMPKFRDFMGDITSQVRKFEVWRKDLARGRQLLPSNLLAQIQQAGPDSDLFLAGLLRLSPKQRQQYVNMWKQGQRDIKQATQIDFTNQLPDWRRHGRKAAIEFVKGVGDERSWVRQQLQKTFHVDLTPVVHRRPHHQAAGHTTVNHNNNSITVNQGHEDLSTTLRKAKHQQKQRARTVMGQR